jgi:hypothetical protein
LNVASPALQAVFIGHCIPQVETCGYENPTFQVDHYHVKEKRQFEIRPFDF